MIAKAKAEAADVKSQLEREIDRVIANFKNEYEVAAVREAAIRTALEKLKQDSGTTSKAVVTLNELEREATAARNVYEGFLKRFEENGTAEPAAAGRPHHRNCPAGGIPGFAQAQADRHCRQPGRFRAGIGAGAAAGNRLPRHHPARTHRGQPGAAASVDRADHRRGLARDRGLAVSDVRHIMERPHSQFAEAIRTLRIGIDARAEPEAKVVLLVSALPNDGKTMIASNLAHNYAMAGIKTLLIDADLRQAGLTSSFLPDAAAGLQEALTEGFAPRDVIVRERSSGLHVLPAKGRLAEQSLAAELLSSKRFADGTAQPAQRVRDHHHRLTATAAGRRRAGDRRSCRPDRLRLQLAADAATAGATGDPQPRRQSRPAGRRRRQWRRRHGSCRR